MDSIKRKPILSFLSEYETYKRVTIEDKSLGFLYYGLNLVIVIYSLIYVILFNKGYMDYETPVGSINLRLYRPNKEIFDTTQMKYCTSKAVNGCLIWDESEVVFPSGIEDSAFIATRVREIYQTDSCDSHSVVCKSSELYLQHNRTEYYIADPENFEDRSYHVRLTVSC